MYEADYGALASLQTLAGRYNVAIIVIHHVRKMGSPDPLELISGTTGLTGAADSVWVLKRERGQREATLFVTGRDVAEQEIALRWGSTLFTLTILGDAAQHHLSRERQEILTVMREAGQRLAPKEVAGALNKPYGTVKKLMWTMKNAGLLEVDEKGRYTLGNPGNQVTLESERVPGPDVPVTGTEGTGNRPPEGTRSTGDPVTAVTGLSLVDGGDSWRSEEGEILDLK